MGYKSKRVTMCAKRFGSGRGVFSMTRQRSLALFVVVLLLAALAAPVYAAPSISVSDMSPEPGEPISFSVSGAPTGNNAWVGIFPNDPSASWWNTNWDEADIAYHYFRNMSGSAEFNVPYKEGDYVIGVFSEDASNDIPIATSGVIQVRFLDSSINVSSTSIEPGETISFTYTNPPRSNTAWIGLFPYDPNASWWNTNWDEADISYHYFRNVANMTEEFTLPYEEGQYIVAMFVEDQGNDLPHAQSQIINVGFSQPSISVSTVSAQPGQELSFSYTNPPSANTAWIALFPYDTNADWWGSNWDDADITYQYLRNITNQASTFTMPNEPGSYIIGIFTEDLTNDIPIAKSDVITVGSGGGAIEQPVYTETPVMTDTVATGEEEVILQVTNIAGVSNNPTVATTFTIDAPYIITYLHTYHYFNNNTPAGTIGLRSSNGTVYGPWQSEGTPGQGGVANADWHVYTYQEIPAGTYTIVDSNPATWSHNSGSGGVGFATVKGIRVGSGSEGTLSGSVVDIDEIMAKSGVMVNIYYNGYLVNTAYTDANGEYSMTALSGYYLLEFVYDGYSTTLYEDVPIYMNDIVYFDHILTYPYQ